MDPWHIPLLCLDVVFFEVARQLSSFRECSALTWGVVRLDVWFSLCCKPSMNGCRWATALPLRMSPRLCLFCHLFGAFGCRGGVDHSARFCAKLQRRQHGFSRCTFKVLHFSGGIRTNGMPPVPSAHPAGGARDTQLKIRQNYTTHQLLRWWVWPFSVAFFGPYFGAHK